MSRRYTNPRIEELADQYIDEHEMDWVEGKYSVSQRRVLLTKWASLGGYAYRGW
jgi:hypothetical protein